MQTPNTIPQLLTETISSLELVKDQPPQRSSAEKPLARPLKNLPPLSDPWQAKWLGLAVSHPSISQAADAIKAFGLSWFRNQKARRLVLTGPTGCGKTEMAKSLFKWANFVSVEAWNRDHWRRPPSSDFLVWQEVCDRLEDSRCSMVELLAPAIESDLLAIDDVGAESDRFKSGKATDALAYLFTRRQDRGHTLITTNVPPDGWAARWDERVRDRLLRNSTVVDMQDCPSWSAL